MVVCMGGFTTCIMLMVAAMPLSHVRSKGCRGGWLGHTSFLGSSDAQIRIWRLVLVTTRMPCDGSGDVPGESSVL